jgi:hypothetical protein
MRKLLLIVFWLSITLAINFVIRYLFIELFVGGYFWIAYFYLELLVPIATLISIVLFFAVNYFINRKKTNPNLLSLTIMRFVLVFTIPILVFSGERLYFFLSDYFLFKT